MQKIPVILVIPNQKEINNALVTLNFNNANLIGIVTETNQPVVLQLSYRNMNFPCFSFSDIERLITIGKNMCWLIYGYSVDFGDFYKMKKFLMSSGIAENNIINFYVIGNLLPYWIANIRYIEKNPINYFATGISYMDVGFDFKTILNGAGVGVNLSCSNQDLRQGYLTAEYVFEHMEKGSVKVVFIGLTPYSLRYDNLKAFSVCPKNLQYIWALKNSTDKTIHGQFLQVLVSDEVKNYFSSITEKQADLNLDKLRANVNKQIPVNAFINWRDKLKNLTKKIFPETIK